MIARQNVPGRGPMRVVLCAAVLTGLMTLSYVPSSAQAIKEPSDDSGVYKDLVFPNKSFVSVPAYVAVKGTLAADWLAFPNNTYSIMCLPSQCLVASVSQIAAKQIGEIDGPIAYPVTKWTDDEVIAEDDDLCARTTIIINRVEKTTLWVQNPINQDTDTCKSFRPIKARTASIEASSFWKLSPPK
jgi:hypothetical protein